MPTKHERAPGVWSLRVNNGTDPVTGKRQVVFETFLGSKTKAAARLAELDREVHRTPVNGGDTTLRKTIELWRAQGTHAAGTSRNYDLGVATIPSHVMKTPVGKIRAETLRQLAAHVRAEHGIDRTRLVHAVVSGALNYAWRMEWIPENVALKVTPPAPKRRKDTTPTAGELAKLLELVTERPELYAWVLVSAVVGARPSEVLALRWSDVDLEYGQVSISKALDTVGGGVKATKTESERTAAIGPLTVAALQLWRERFRARARELGVKPVRDPFVFVRPRTFDGATPWRPDYGSKQFRKLRDVAGINPEIRRYDLRHHVANTLLDNDVDLRTVGDRLGHTRYQTTADVYGRRVRASDQVSADILERGLAGRRDGAVT